MKKLLHQLPLILGCLFLAWIMILLVRDAAMSYERSDMVSEVHEYEDEFNDESEYEYTEQEKKVEPSFLKKSTEGLYCIVNSFIYAYHECGYYDYELSYMHVGKQAYEYLSYGFILLYAAIVFLFCLPVLAAGYTAQIYILSGGIFALILLLGKVPQYENLIFLIAGWIYINLSKQWMRLKGEKNLRTFLKGFPAALLPVYAAVILFIMSLPVLMPNEILPEADKETKDVIFNRLQEIRLVSDQYEEAKKQKENPVTESLDGISMDPEEDMEENPEESDDLENNRGDTSADDSEVDLPEQDNSLQQKENPDGDSVSLGDDGQKNGADGGMGGLRGISSFKESLFSLNSGGGVSGGRTDLTGNLKFNGRSVLRATMDHRPEKNLYIRLFYAEDYEDSRWKQAGDPQFDDSVRELTMSTFYSLKDGGAGRQEETFLYLADPARSSDEIVLGNSKSASRYYPEQLKYLTGTCMEVPEELENLFEKEFPGIFQADQVSDSVSKNEAIADKIEKILEETAYYTLSPGKAPKNKDFIQWFLTENKKGYCMHFAAAGVMMLRAAGVSSRYAEGYFVPVSAWEQQEDGSWSAEILDSNAHAWAEIYQENGAKDDDEFSDGCWVPVEMTPAYRGELAGSFAGQQDAYVGKTVIPGWVVWAVRMIFWVVCVVLMTVIILIFFRKFRIWYEYRMIHTGDARQDIKNMMKLLLQKPACRNREIRKIFKKNYLTRQELNKEILLNIPEWNQDQESEECFEKFSTYVYRAAFDGKINEEDRKKAGVLYRKLRKKR